MIIILIIISMLSPSFPSVGCFIVRVCMCVCVGVRMSVYAREAGWSLPLSIFIYIVNGR